MPDLAFIRTNLGQVAAALIMALLALACGVQTVRINGLHWDLKVGAFTLPFLNMEGWKETATKAQAALAQVKAAQPKAEAAQVAENRKPAIITASIARTANAQTPAYLSKVASVAARHAVPALRLCAVKAPDGRASQADLRAADPPAQGDDGKAGSPDMVSVARSDWDRLNREAALRVQLYQIGQSWIAQGVAVADDAPGDAPAPAK